MHSPPRRARAARAALAVAAAMAVAACNGGDRPDPGGGAAGDSTAAQDTAAYRLAFANAVSAPPAGWSGPVFALSHDYPATAPAACTPETCPWLSIPVNFNDTTPPTWEGPWADYMAAVLAYVREGQTLSPEGWNVQVNGETRWFHVPWMAFDTVVGREFIHGFTNERTADESDFVGVMDHMSINALPVGNGRTTKKFETWAVGMYNPAGGYAIGQAMGRGVPNLDANGRARGLPFPEGTVVAKILFTTATPADVPYLRNAPRWMADRHVQTSDSTFGTAREPQPVHMVQMDIAVTDRRSPSGWVLGTFAYNGTVNSDDIWERLQPVGLQWGNDPQTFPAVAEAQSRPIHQSVINQLDIYEHLGCRGRLAGPVDNPQSSCVSCHQSAYAPSGANRADSMGTNVPPAFGFDGLCEENSQENIDYFTNIRYPDAYPGGQYAGAVPLDFSLQLQVAFGQYGQWRQCGGPAPCVGAPAGSTVAWVMRRPRR